jgi:hypothetical protein
VFGRRHARRVRVLAGNHPGFELRTQAGLAGVRRQPCGRRAGRRRPRHPSRPADLEGGRAGTKPAGERSEPPCPSPLATPSRRPAPGCRVRLPRRLARRRGGWPDRCRRGRELAVPDPSSRSGSLRSAPRALRPRHPARDPPSRPRGAPRPGYPAPRRCRLARRLRRAPRTPEEAPPARRHLPPRLWLPP